MSFYQITINIPHIHFEDYIKCIENYNTIDVSGASSSMDYIHACEIGTKKKHQHIHSYTYIDTDKIQALTKQLRRQFSKKYATTKGNVLQIKEHDSQKIGYFVKEHRRIHYKERTNISRERILEYQSNWIKNRKDFGKINKEDRNALEKYLLNNYNDSIDKHSLLIGDKLLKFQLEFIIDLYIEYKLNKHTGLNQYREKDYLRMIICKINADYCKAYKNQLKDSIYNELCDWSISKHIQQEQKQQHINDNLKYDLSNNSL